MSPFVMIPRYTQPEMAALWSDHNKYTTWLQVELTVLQVQEGMGLVPAGTYEAVKAKATFDIDRMAQIEAEVKHDVIAFVSCVAENVGEAGRWLHLGMTSSDLIDTSFALLIQQAGQLILKRLDALIATLKAKATEHKMTVQVGRSHGIHAEPITFGLKLLVWVDELQRQRTRVENAIAENAWGKLSGAVGTYANMSPDVEAQVCEKLGLTPSLTATQVIQRDIHATFMLSLANLASSLEKMATELRALQKTDILEVEEPFTPGQKGSSAMPHKRNPITGENITGLARLVRSYALPTLENIALWHERDISHSGVERVIFPDACLLMDTMLTKLERTIKGLVVYPDNMRRNMMKYGGAIFSQRVLLALVEQGGLSREAAYTLVQRNAHTAWNTENGDFKANLRADKDVLAALSDTQLCACFDEQHMLSHVDTIFKRFGL
jgi:adenylosuccinate lyase